MNNDISVISNIFYIIKKLMKRYREHSISAYSAQMAFFLMLSIFPFLIFLFTILGRLSMNTDLLMQVLQVFFPESVHKLAFDFINNYILVKDNSVISVSIIATLWSASKGIRGLMVSLNKAYEIKETRGFFVIKIIDILYTVLIVFVIVILLALPNIGVDLYNFVNRYIEIKWEIFTLYNRIKIIMLPLTLVLIMSLIYMYIPNIKQKPNDVIWGTLFSIFGWATLSYFFTIFLNNFSNYKLVYGSLATVIILMFWLYFGSMILIIGGEINSILKKIEG
ncbi:YihY/virulence factor BrkB family protein [Clostridiaceae bacterium HSG29]|nr:YihY/virulence factor BrkB family protein [Clostridiaceae bacterium HSG29]